MSCLGVFQPGTLNPEPLNLRLYQLNQKKVKHKNRLVNQLDSFWVFQDGGWNYRKIQGLQAEFYYRDKTAEGIGRIALFRVHLKAIAIAKVSAYRV
jgi:hypothetical protein